ncbi:peptide chain release factor 1 [Lyticum sinuosum]|uniref:Peptide chain release factor 1 n=1 Tax=Lyticum sinuosum TaxID=1332059 RepID=A0AAE5AHS8_9RICK|nr:peptide chain release factor 1 [Lyticum sinuosum]MDZ5761341.1 Peptide chain release factor 1 [Lyticum sinuosum]
MSLIEKLQAIVKKYEELNQKMLEITSSNEYQQNAKDVSEIENIIPYAKAYLERNKEISEINEILENTQKDDKEMVDMFNSELLILKEDVKNLDLQLRYLLLPKDKADDKGVILELRCGTGGEEAALFCAVLFRMYKRYSEKKRWKFEILEYQNTGLDGCKEASVSINGESVYAHLKFESGVHRVQRVPDTESNGRIHTSTATVAILPEAEDFEVEIKESEIKIDVYRSSGAGGQHVNTTDSAVRITHIPTGTVVCQQDEKSQHKNKAKALKILRARIYDMQRQSVEDERSEARRIMVGSGDRSERIRTYNYPQNRVTDHRINVTSYNLESVINDGDIDQFIEKLITENQMAMLANYNNI